MSYRREGPPAESLKELEKNIGKQGVGGFQKKKQKSYKDSWGSMSFCYGKKKIEVNK